MSTPLSYSKWDGIGDADSDDEAQPQPQPAHETLMRAFQNAHEMKALAEAEYSRGESAGENGHAECYRKATLMYEDCMREIIAGSSGEITDDNIFDCIGTNETIVALKGIYRACELNIIACLLKQNKWQHVIIACKRLLQRHERQYLPTNERIRVLYFVSSAFLRLNSADSLREASIYSKELHSILKKAEDGEASVGCDEMTQYNSLFDDIMYKNERAALASTADFNVMKAKIVDLLKAGMACYKQKDYASSINYFSIVSQNSQLMAEAEERNEAASPRHKEGPSAEAYLDLDHSEVFRRLQTEIDFFVNRPHSYMCLAETGLAISHFVTNYSKHSDSLQERLVTATERLAELIEEVCKIIKTAVALSCCHQSSKRAVTLQTMKSTLTEIMNPVVKDESADAKKARDNKLVVERKVMESADDKLFLLLTFSLNANECLAELLDEKKQDPAAADAVAVRAISTCDRFIEHFDSEFRRALREEERLEKAANTCTAHSEESVDILRRKAVFLLRRGSFLNEVKTPVDDSFEAITEACNMYKRAADIFSGLGESHRSFIVYQNCAYAYQLRGRIRPFFYMNDEDLKMRGWIAEESSKNWLRAVGEGTRVLEDNFTKLFRLDSALANRALPLPHEQHRLLNNKGTLQEEKRSMYDSIRTYRLNIISSCLMAGVCSLHCNHHEAKTHLERSLEMVKKFVDLDALYFIYNAPSTSGERSPDGLCSDNTFDRGRNYVDCLDELKGSCNYHLSFCFLKIKMLQRAEEEIVKAIDIFKRTYAGDVHSNHHLFVSYVLQTFLFTHTKKFDEADKVLAYLEGDFMIGLAAKNNDISDDDIVFSLRSKKLDNKTTHEIYAAELQRLKEVVAKYKEEFSKPTIITHYDRMTSTTAPWRRIWHFHMLLVHVAICEKTPEDVMTIALFVLVVVFVTLHRWHSRQYAQYVYDSQGIPHVKLPNDNLRTHFPDHHFPEFDERQIPFYEHSGE